MGAMHGKRMNTTKDVEGGFPFIYAGPTMQCLYL